VGLRSPFAFTSPMVESGRTEFPAGVLKRAVWCHLAGIAWFAITMVQTPLSFSISGLVPLLGYPTQVLGIASSAVVAGLSLLAFPFLSGFLASFICWKVTRSFHPFVDDCGKAATNFQATMGLYSFCAFLVSALLTLVTCGPALSSSLNSSSSNSSMTNTLVFIGIGVMVLSAVGAFAWSIFQAVVVITAAVRASKGQMYVYPFSRQFFS
jgi:uncharacterized Tic20 family protein